MIRNWLLETLNEWLINYLSDVGFILYGGGKTKTPKAPDYAAAAQAQGIANLGAARATAKLNNPNIINPYGTQMVTYGADPDVGTVTQTLSPAERNIYDKSVRQRTNIGDVGISGSQSLKDIIGKRIEFSGAPTLGNGEQTREKVYQALMRRVNEDTTNQRDDKNSQLIAAGIRPGNKAYDDAQNLISRQYNDARGNAEVGASNAANQQFGMDSQARQQYISELLAQRQTPLNEINALMSGSQVNNPFAGNLGPQGGANVQAAPIFAGAQAQGQADLNSYNAKQAGSNAFTGGLFSLGAAGLGKFSDRRLKNNIKRIGTYANGLAKYAFDYIWGESSIGVMADEVEKIIPEAIMTHSSGYKMVNYALIGE